MGRPSSDLEDYRGWRQRLERYQTTEIEFEEQRQEAPDLVHDRAAVHFLSHRRQSLAVGASRPV